ncbi:sorting nexin [Anaeramoeba flamelloides]|uniref:Sorting nexin n=1 Tax=Anaeramoeba flamelloides TaxID=1746091 RepID=A0AAV7ZNF3_9EUKA|nr:sorting nexin [Anaeramoeba flamelloides]
MSNQIKFESYPYTYYFQIQQQESYLSSLKKQKKPKETNKKTQNTNVSSTKYKRVNNCNVKEYKKTLKSSFPKSRSSSSIKSTTQSSESSEDLCSQQNSLLISTPSSEFKETLTIERTKTFREPSKQQEDFSGSSFKIQTNKKNENQNEDKIGNQNEEQKKFNSTENRNVGEEQNNLVSKNFQNGKMKSNNWKIQISSPETLWAGMSKFTIYKVYSIRNDQEKIKNYHTFENNIKMKNRSRNKSKSISKSNKQHFVKRRYSDFVWLRDNLIKDFPGVIVPTLPEKQIVSKFAYKILEMRRKKFEIFLKKISFHPLLSLSRAFIMFLEKDIDNIFKIKLNRDQVSYGINRLHTNYLEYQCNNNQLENLPTKIKFWEKSHNILKQLLTEITKFGIIQEKIQKRLKNFSFSIAELKKCQSNPHLNEYFVFVFEQLNLFKKKINEENQISNFLLRGSVNELISNCLEISKSYKKRNGIHEEYQNAIKFEKKCLNKLQDFQNKNKKCKSWNNLHFIEKDYKASRMKKQLLESKDQKITCVFIDELSKMENQRSIILKNSLLEFSKKQFEISKYSTGIWGGITQKLQNFQNKTTKKDL